eukprot:876571-Rhodomonas_salina.3
MPRTAPAPARFALAAAQAAPPAIATLYLSSGHDALRILQEIHCGRSVLTTATKNNLPQDSGFSRVILACSARPGRTHRPFARASQLQLPAHRHCA